MLYSFRLGRAEKEDSKYCEEYVCRYKSKIEFSIHWVKKGERSQAGIDFITDT